MGTISGNIIEDNITPLTTPLEFLLYLFPSFKSEDIYKTLIKNHYDLYQTLDDLTVNDEEEDYEDTSNPQEISGGVQQINNNGNEITRTTTATTICKYYLNGVCNNSSCPFLHQTIDGKQPTIAPICKFYLNEGCRITNCPYRHSSETVLCKFWMMGSCTKGDDCIYSHQINNALEIYDKKLISNELNSSQNINNYSSAVSTKNEPPKLDKNEDFPTLGPKTNRNNNNSNQFPSLGSNKTASPPLQSQFNVNFKVKKNKNITKNNNSNTNTTQNNIPKTTTSAISPPPPQQQKSNIIKYTIDNDDEPFPTLSNSKKTPKKKKNLTSIHSNINSMSDMSYMVQIKQLEETFKHVTLNDISKEFKQNNNDIQQTTESLTSKFGPPRQPQKIQQNPSSTTISNGHRPTPIPSKHINWVETGKDVSNLYQKHRQEAIIHARERNLCFNLAAKAFLSGDAASAKRLSAKGHEHDRIMKDLHTEAKDIIFSERNMSFDSDTLDLHGLHVKEAIDILQDRLDYNSQEPLYIIIGTGHHTTTSSARLPTKIKEFLHSSGYRYKDCSYDKREGLLMVYK